MAKSVGYLTLGLGLGLDLRLVSSSPAVGSVLGMEPLKKVLLDA